MGTPILRPADVVAGDLIKLQRPYGQATVCKVVRAGVSGVTVQLPSGAENRLPYTEVRLGAVSVLTHVNFYSLDARERWLATAPDGVIADAARGFVSIVLTADDMRDLPATTARLIDARQLVSGLASCPPEIPVDVFIRAVALAAATFVRTRCDLETVIDDAWSAALTGGQP